MCLSVFVGHMTIWNKDSVSLLLLDVADEVTFGPAGFDRRCLGVTQVHPREMSFRVQSSLLLMRM